MTWGTSANCTPNARPKTGSAIPEPNIGRTFQNTIMPTFRYKEFDALGNGIWIFDNEPPSQVR